MAKQAASVRPITIENEALKEAYEKRLASRKALGDELIAQGVGKASGVLEYILITFMNRNLDTVQIKLQLKLDGTVGESYHDA